MPRRRALRWCMVFYIGQSFLARSHGMLHRFLPRRVAFLLFITLVGALSACHSVLPGGNRSLEYAYVGPATATLRQDLAARSETVTTVKHAERLEILDSRRRLVKVRASDGAQGWIDANLLLTAEQVQELKRIGELASSLPSQGKASVSDVLNAHTEPFRQSPSLFQVPENGKVEVLAHRIASRTPRGSQVAEAIHPKALPKAAKGKGSGKEVPAVIAQPESARKADAADGTPPPVYEDWSLVRSDEGQVGWALSRMLYMEIPDEVIRYTGGNRVTAFLDLGEVDDEGRNKHNWVWTTTSGRGKPFDFDGMRVLIWNPVKHRYETALWEKELDGYYPLKLVLPEPVAGTTSAVADPAVASSKASLVAGPIPSPTANKDRRFTMVVKDPHNSQTYLRTYSLAGRRVKLLSKVVIAENVNQPAIAGGMLGAAQGYDPLAPPPPPEQGWWDRTTGKAKDWVSGFGGK